MPVVADPKKQQDQNLTPGQNFHALQNKRGKQNQKAQLGPNAQCHKITTDSKSESIHVNENAQLVVTQVEIKTLTEQSNKIHFSVPGRL